jgi:hypothetical protein
MSAHGFMIPIHMSSFTHVCFAYYMEKGGGCKVIWSLTPPGSTGSLGRFSMGVFTSSPRCSQFYCLHYGRYRIAYGGSIYTAGGNCSWLVLELHGALACAEGFAAVRIGGQVMLLFSLYCAVGKGILFLCRTFILQPLAF